MGNMVIIPSADGNAYGLYPGGDYSQQANVLFSTDMEAADGTANGFDDVRATESGGSASITFVNDGDSQVAQFNLVTGGLQDVWLRENFGDYVGAGAAQDDLWITFTWLVSDFDALNAGSNITNKVCTLQFSNGVTSTRTFQIIITAINAGGAGFVFRIEHLWFDRSTGSYAGSEWFGSYTTDTITEGQKCYLKLHVQNSTNGAQDGIVDLWYNDTLVVSAHNVDINDVNGDSPNSLIFGTYNGTRSSTVNGYVQYDNLTIQDQDPGSWAPSETGTMPTWQGISGSTITATDAIIDMRTDLSTNAPSIIRNTNGATQVFVAGGGYYGQGTNRFTPNYSNPQCYCGIGSIGGFGSQPDASRVNVGVLLRWGQGFVDSWMHSSYKYIILIRNPNDAAHARPMAIVKGGTTTDVLAPGNGTVTNTTDDPYTNWHTFNDLNSEPDVNALKDVYAWVEFQVDCNGPNGTITIKTWSADSVYQGQTLMQLMTNGEGSETFGGVIQTLDTISYLEQGTAPGGAPTNPWYEMEYARIITGSTADITPPPGFPGHNSANW
ncbi:MAG: hypothetical protein JAY60_18530 [Candidatus Thiodiazotropha weberae]|nr:hypothetical protein [Candidatus Thiodiazotropha weberae]